MVVLYDAGTTRLLKLLLVIVLGTAGLSAPGTLYAAMTAQLKAKQTLLPLLLFPLIVPALLASVKATSLVILGDPMEQSQAVDRAAGRVRSDLLVAVRSAVRSCRRGYDWQCAKAPGLHRARRGICCSLGSYCGLFVAPAEQYMGDVQRIMYVHVPTAWNWMLAVLFAFVCAVAFLFTQRHEVGRAARSGPRSRRAARVPALLPGRDLGEADVGRVVGLGSAPDLGRRAALRHRSASSRCAVRRRSDERAIWSAVATIIASVDLPIVYFSVKWWNSLHQAAVDAADRVVAVSLPLRVNAFGVLFLMIGFIMLRTRIAALRLRAGDWPCRSRLRTRKQESSHDRRSRQRRLGVRLGRVRNHRARCFVDLRRSSLVDASAGGAGTP